MKKPLLIAVQGPTASGKTAVAVQLATWLQTEIISSDSRQFFKELKIGAAPPTEAELQTVPHHFVQHLGVQQEYNAGIFERDVLAKLDDLFLAHNTVIMVGGSGLYTNAVLQGFDDLPEADPKIREELRTVFTTQGIEALQQEIALKDPDYFAVVDKNNPHRLIRALEVIRQSGLPYSAQRNYSAAERPFNTLNLVMDVPREVLYERINYRVDKMMEMGLEAEARALFEHRHLQPLNTVGYKELFAFFKDECSLEEAVNLIKQNTRRFAKRQITWFKRDKNAHWVNPENIDEMKRIIAEFRGQ